MRKTVAFLCVLGLLAIAAPAQAADNTWTYGGGGSWFTTASWSDGVPTLDDNCYMQDTGVGGYTVTIAETGATCNNIEVGDGVGTSAQPSILQLQTGGSLSMSLCLECQDGGYAIYRQTGGLAEISGLRIGRYGGGTEQFGIAEISGGTLKPYYRSSGGTIGDAGARFGYRPSDNRRGTMHVIGSNSSITLLGGESDGRVGFEVNSCGTLIAELDAGGVSTIVVDTSVSANLLWASGDDAAFNITSGGIAPVIDMRRAVGSPPEKNDSFVLLTADYIDDGGVVLSPGDEVFWSLAVVPGTATAAGAANNGDNGSVTATFLYIPGDCASFPTTNNDVDDADLSILLSNFGTGTGMTWAHGDFTNDGGVADADLSVLLAHWDTVGSVPEPATLALLGVGLVGVILRRRRT